jgi:hypothetical protein
MSMHACTINPPGLIQALVPKTITTFTVKLCLDDQKDRLPFIDLAAETQLPILKHLKSKWINYVKVPQRNFKPIKVFRVVLDR